MQEVFLTLVESLRYRVNDLSQAIENLRAPNDDLEQAVLHEQWARVHKLSAQLRLLQFADFDAFPAPDLRDLERLLLEERVQRRMQATIDHGGKLRDLRHYIDKAERDVYSIIHPLEVVGKWPPDSAPR